MGAIVTNHCENGEMVAAGQRMMKQLGVMGPEGHPQSRPPACEEESTNRVIRIAQQVNVPVYIVHCSCKEAMEAISRAKRAGQRTYGEVFNKISLCVHKWFSSCTFAGPLWAPDDQR